MLFLCLLGSMFLLLRLFRVRIRSLMSIVFTALVFSFFPMKFALVSGQINLVVLLFVVLFVYWYVRNRPHLAGIAIMLALTVKLYPALGRPVERQSGCRNNASAAAPMRSGKNGDMTAHRAVRVASAAVGVAQTELSWAWGRRWSAEVLSQPQRCWPSDRAKLRHRPSGRGVGLRCDCSIGCSSRR
jgi:Glycosyltransferase family 87